MLHKLLKHGNGGALFILHVLTAIRILYRCVFTCIMCIFV